MGGDLGPFPNRVHGTVFPMHDVIVDAILYIARCVGLTEKPLVIRFVFGEKQRDISLAINVSLTRLGMRERYYRMLSAVDLL